MYSHTNADMQLTNEANSRYIEGHGFVICYVANCCLGVLNIIGYVAHRHILRRASKPNIAVPVLGGTSQGWLCQNHLRALKLIVVGVVLARVALQLMWLPIGSRH